MFDISLKDLLANDVGKITGEINKYTNNKPLKTSRMTSNAGDPMNVSLFNMSEMLMRIPAYEDPATLLSNYEQIISGGVGGLWGELSLMPGFEHLLPEDVRQTLEEASLGPDAGDPVFGDQGGVGPGTEPDGSLSVTGPASKVIGLARNEIGYRENPPGTNRNKFAAIAGVANGQPWCFTEDTLITTPQGMKFIKDIQVDDEVITADGNIQKAQAIATRKAPTIKIKALGVAGTTTTNEHPYLARKKKNGVPNDRCKALSDYHEPSWVPAGELNRHDLIALPKHKTEKTIHVDSEKAYLIGLWLGDGGKRKDRPNVIMLYPGKHEKEHVDKVLANLGINYYCIERRTNLQYEINNKEIAAWFEGFGNNAYNKQVSPEVFSWNIEARRALVEGYFYADGYKDGEVLTATTVSKALAYSIAQLIRCTYHQTTSIRTYKKTKAHTIEGRAINQSQSWVVGFRPEAGFSPQAYEDPDCFWVPVRNITEGKEDIVYNMSVEGEHTYIADGAAVHNCATFLMAMFKKADMPQTGLLNPFTETSLTAYERKKQAGNQPRIGALAFTNWISGRRVSHVGLVVGIEENHIISVDGNTSGPRGGGSQYNGGWVAEKRRTRSSIVKYAYPKYSNLPDAAERVHRS